MSLVAQRTPDAPVLQADGGRSWSYRWLEHSSDRVAAALLGMGFGPGTRTVFLVKPGPDFLVLAFALWKAGSVLVAIDPGMGPAGIGRCIDQARPGAFAGTPEAHWGRRLLGWGRGSISLTVVSGKGFLGWGMTTVEDLLRKGSSEKRPVFPQRSLDDPAAIVFTSGSTGPPKGVILTHANLAHQARLIADLYDIGEGETELITFPHFSFYAPSWGVAMVMADMDFVKPATASPEKLVKAIEAHRIDGLFASPAILRRLAQWTGERGTKLPTLRRLVSAGAPLAPRVLETMSAALADSVVIHTPYGATEAMPVTSIASPEILEETRQSSERGAGVCVGRPLDGVTVKIMRILDEPVEALEDASVLGSDTVGEIVVAGPTVSRSYLGSSDNLDSKLKDRAGDLYHRTGDLGYLDDSGRLWYCGRKSQRVLCQERTYFTVSCEAVFNAHPQVVRTALFGHSEDGVTRPALCVESQLDQSDTAGLQRLSRELRELGEMFEATRGIDRFFFLQDFPVDARHNSKIKREELPGLVAGCRAW